MTTNTVSAAITSDETNFHEGFWLTLIDPFYRDFCARDHSLLFVDDDPDQLMLFELVLSKAGYQVEGISSATIALDRMRNRQFDLVISDLMMPGISGESFISLLRDHELQSKERNVPVIVLTASDQGAGINLLNTGADMYCQKKDAAWLLLPQIRFLLS
jgi:DNA-binding response OmpR family regulator